MKKYFNPITQNKKEYTQNSERVSRKRHPFNDQRLNSVHIELAEQMQKVNKIAIQQISKDASQSARFYRFYGNEKVTPEELIKMNSTINPEVLKGKKILCLGDSTTFNMKKNEGHVNDFGGFGVLQDGKTPGFHAHASLVLDAENGCVLGLSDLILWNRPADKTKFSRKLKKERESYKWHLGASNSHEILASAVSVNYVFDREADDFDLFVHLKKHLKSDFTIRFQHNRKVRFEEKTCRVTECLAGLCVALVYNVKLKTLDHYSKTLGHRKKRKKREAELELRFANVELFSPKGYKGESSMSVAVVEIREITADLLSSEEPLHWKLWTSQYLNNASEALQVVEHYLFRWTIEQLFRTMKKKGFNQEATQLGSVDGILKQTAITFKAATQVMQLVNARNQQDAPPIETVFDEEEQKVLKKVNERLEGKTEKLKNPFPSTQLSFAAWIIARLGGWKGYQAQKPAGPITMKIGLYKFKIMIEGFQLFNST